MYTVSECCAPDLAMDASSVNKDFPTSPDRVRIKGRGGLELAIVRSSSPVPATCESPRETNHHWWDVLKGLGRRRRKSTTNAYAADFLDVTWQLNQVERLSEDKTNEEYVTSLAYDETGDLLAAGSKDGRVFVYRRQDQPQVDHRSDHSSNGRPFQLYSCFQSHEKEFDHLRSVETDEKICRLHFLKRPNRHNFLLTANDRNVKLWKLSEKVVEFDDSVLANESAKKFNNLSKNSLRIPRYRPTDLTVCAVPKRVYFASHNLRMNALSASCDLVTFLTADDLTVNLWHVEIPDLSFNIVDTKPDNIEDLAEVITAAEFHPSSSSQFAYASSKGSIRLCDLRSNSLCDQHSKLFHDNNKDAQQKSFFSDIICCICDARFSYDGQYLLTRDYLNLKVWDLRIESHPVNTYSVCEPLRGKLSKLYESDQIFDKFECSWGYNDRFISTGTYGNYFKVVDRISGHAVTLKTTDSSRSAKGRQQQQQQQQQRRRKNSVGSSRVVRADEPNVDRLDFRTKCAHTLWSPADDILTNATANGLNFFHVRQNGCEQPIN